MFTLVLAVEQPPQAHHQGRRNLSDAPSSSRGDGESGSLLLTAIDSAGRRDAAAPADPEDPEDAAEANDLIADATPSILAAISSRSATVTLTDAIMNTETGQNGDSSGLEPKLTSKLQVPPVR